MSEIAQIFETITQMDRDAYSGRSLSVAAMDPQMGKDKLGGFSFNIW